MGQSDYELLIILLLTKYSIYWEILNLLKCGVTVIILLTLTIKIIVINYELLNKADVFVWHIGFPLVSLHVLDLLSHSFRITSSLEYTGTST